MGGCRMANSIIFIAEFDYKIKIGGLVQTTTKILRGGGGGVPSLKRPDRGTPQICPIL